MEILEDIWDNLYPGDIVLKQKIDEKGNFYPPQLVIIVGISIWDMALAVYFTDFKEFEVDPTVGVCPKVYSFAEWSEGWNILGHWKTIPTFKELLKARRLAKV